MHACGASSCTPATGAERARKGVSRVLARARAASSAAEAVAHAERGLAGGRLLEEQGPEAGVFYILVNGRSMADHLELAQRQLFEHALNESISRQSVPGRTISTAWLGYLAFARGRLTDSQEQTRAAMAQLETLGWGAPVPMSLASFWTHSASLACSRRRRRPCAHMAAMEHRQGNIRRHLLAARGRLRIACGRPAEGVEDLLEYDGESDLVDDASQLAASPSEAAAGLAAAGDEPRHEGCSIRTSTGPTTGVLPGAIGRVLGSLARLESGDRGIDRRVRPCSCSNDRAGASSLPVSW